MRMVEVPDFRRQGRRLPDKVITVFFSQKPLLTLA